MSSVMRSLSLLATPPIAENVQLKPIPGGFCNLTELVIGDQVAALLSYGPRFLLPSKGDIPEVFSGMGEMVMEVEQHLGVGDCGPVFLELLHTNVKEGKELFSQKQPSFMELAVRRAVSETHDFFRMHPTACLVQSDKGNKTCLLYLADYESKMRVYVEKCLSKGVYTMTNLNRVAAVKILFNKLRQQFFDTVKFPDGPIPNKLCAMFKRFGKGTVPHLYGNVKCHKDGAPMRPICSTVQWYSRPVQQILYFVLKEYFGGVLCPNNVVRVAEVAQYINHLTPKPGYVFVKFDVTDMYGSMDKGRICELLERILMQIEVEGLSIIPTGLVIQMLRFSLRQSCIVGYQDKVYVQTNGLPQGACDSGFLATLYLDYILQLHHEELFTAHRVYYWAKYMDDFLLYMPPRYIEFFKTKFEFLTGLKLEIEPEEAVTDGDHFALGVRRTIPFLDICVHTMEDGTYATSSFRKPTSSMRTLHALSNTVYSYKVNTTYAYINTILQRTSTNFLIHDILKLHERVLMNGYSHNFMECITYKAIDSEIKKLQNGGCTNFRDKDRRISVLLEHLRTYSLDAQNHYQVMQFHIVNNNNLKSSAANTQRAQPTQSTNF